MTWHEGNEPVPAAGPIRHVAIFDRGVLALRRRCQSRTARLEAVVEALTESRMGERVGVLLVRDLTFNMFDHDPDEVLATIADICRPYGLHITTDPPPVPRQNHTTTLGAHPGMPLRTEHRTDRTDHHEQVDRLDLGYSDPTAEIATSTYFTVRTDYAPDTTVREHFATAEDRRQSLLERADILMSRPNMIPPMVLADENRLAALICLFIEPATVRLYETTAEELRPQSRPSSWPDPCRDPRPGPRIDPGVEPRRDRGQQP